MIELAPSSLYREAPIRTRIHVNGRWRIFPFPALAEFVFPQGSMVDLGCGYGLWLLYLAQRYPELQLFGIDPDKEKIRLARETAEAWQPGRVRFAVGAAQALELPSCRMVSLVDVLYLIPLDQQEAVIEAAARQLERGGRLLLKEISTQPHWKFAWNLFEETLAVRLLHITYGQQFYFRPDNDWRCLLERCGLRVETRRLDRGYPHPHILFLGEKP
jgi:ubiquinone/menaquinone biosynthesis C-methylase UbiE